jgi:hypothetical protein
VKNHSHPANYFNKKFGEVAKFFFFFLKKKNRKRFFLAKMERKFAKPDVKFLNWFQVEWASG